jgi:glycosyltransferase involved in cell wall biosynthesis
MRLAFYAPMKPPTHPTPSGDRAMARALMTALRHGGAGVELVSDLRLYDRTGDAGCQARLQDSARHEVHRLIDLGRDADWTAWFTYHNYYKAPDLLGPAVARALHIPYLQVEASRARKRLQGPWAGFATAAEDACNAADAIFYVTEQDEDLLRALAPPGQVLRHLRPFLPVPILPAASLRSGGMLSVGMMREGDKVASYTLIAQTLALLTHPDWHLDIAGDGPARPLVEARMRPFGDRIRFLGELSAEDLAQRYSTAALLFWPGVNEAFGLSYLEAQAAGIPVVAQDRPGVRDVLAPGTYPKAEDGPVALANRIDTLLHNPNLERDAALAARQHIADHHLIGSATQTLFATLKRVMA